MIRHLFCHFLIRKIKSLLNCSLIICTELFLQGNYVMYRLTEHWQRTQRERRHRLWDYCANKTTKIADDVDNQEIIGKPTQWEFELKNNLTPINLFRTKKTVFLSVCSSKSVLSEYWSSKVYRFQTVQKKYLPKTCCGCSLQNSYYRLSFWPLLQT